MKQKRDARLGSVPLGAGLNDICCSLRPEVYRPLRMPRRHVWDCRGVDDAQPRRLLHSQIRIDHTPCRSSRGDGCRSDNVIYAGAKYQSIIQATRDGKTLTLQRSLSRKPQAPRLCLLLQTHRSGRGYSLPTAWPGQSAGSP
jgi:hypothetical protein